MLKKQLSGQTCTMTFEGPPKATCRVYNLDCLLTTPEGDVNITLWKTHRRASPLKYKANDIIQ